jgi:hypothetical protein
VNIVVAADTAVVAGAETAWSAYAAEAGDIPLEAEAARQESAA